MAAGASGVEMICLGMRVSSSNQSVALPMAPPGRSGERAEYALHVRHAANGAHDARQVLAVSNLQLEAQRGAVGVALLQRYRIDIRLRARDGRCHRGENADAVVDVELDLRGEH